MIDEKKYEGYLTGSDGQKTWRVSDWALKNAESVEQIDATCALLTDAPLLLEEVKRLQGESEANRCPTCGSADITYLESFYDGGVKVGCEDPDCASEWFEIWRHVRIEMIEGEDNR